MYFPPSQFSHRFGAQFFTVEIPEFQLVEDKESHKTYAIFKFVVKRGRQTRVMYYRYSEILQLHDYLCSTSLGLIASICNFPGKTLRPKLDQSFLEKRRVALEEYFHKLLCNGRHISQLPNVQKFLQLDKFEVNEYGKE
ncbi:hypothetical protein RFI_08538 [Reticulomyxa filosa]|uniref:PX domain-containing protein n=1 Tax=Reticulomyxa filosa TaxID=46433 RepID=X6NS88_RETFI|nr:hypothetical protein RFI_08538 [Reticulomyxa filosa]|eukprot:ETO28594.1 hypothetical protein RFI_08538 [Reticulomyxa filosa]